MEAFYLQDVNVDWYLSRGGSWYESQDSAVGGFRGPFRPWTCPECDFDISARELHQRNYAGAHRLTIQTCVSVEEREGVMIVEAYLDRSQIPIYGERIELYHRINPYPHEL